MPPKDITQTGPQTGGQIRQSREEDFSQYYGDYRRWNNYMKMRNSGFSDSQVYQMYQDWVFKNTYGNDPNYDKLTKMSAEQRTRKLITDKKMQEGAAEGRANAEFNFNLPEVDVNPWAHPERGRMDFMRPDLVEARVRDNYEDYKDYEGSMSEPQATAYNAKVVEEANRLFPKITKTPEPQNEIESAIVSVMEALNPNINDRLLNIVQKQGIDRVREKYILDNLVVPANKNTMLGMSEEQFVKSLPYLSSAYNQLAGSRWLPEKDIDYHQLYLANIKDINSGKLYKVQANVEKYFSNIVAKYQPNWSGGDDLVHSRVQVFFEQAAAGAVENLMDFALVPAGLVQGGWNALVDGDNFWEEASYLPSISHDIAHGITGDHSQAYGDSWGSAMANSGYTVGTMAADAGLMAIPYGKLASGMLRPMSRLGVASERFSQAARALESAKASKIFGTANALNFGVIEGSIDALDVRDGILEDARRTAMSLPEDQRAEFMEYATHEANTAYGRTMLEESLVVNAGTLLGLGFYGSLAPASRMSRIAPKWQTNLGNQLMSGNKWQKAGLFAGKVLEGNMRLTAGELLEEYAQGMSSGINRARANYNIDNYAMALHYGLGAEYLANTQLGFMQGLERFAPQAWTEMDPENLTKQVLLSTMMFRGLHMPGRGKTRAQINIDNDTKIGKIWDNIRKFSPVQTGIGQIIADAKSDVFDIENSLEHGFRALTQNDDIQDVLQTQAALTDIGIQMQDALNNQDITSYQKLAAAYQVAQAVMLANASTKNTRFGKHYEQVLSNRANFDNLSAEDKQKVLANYLDELQVNTIKQLPQEEQIKVMKETAQRALDLKEKASAAFEKFSQNGEFLGEDIRPLVYAEVLSGLAPSIIEENWSALQPSLQEVFSKSQFEGVNPEALEYVKTNYFNQSNFADRAEALASFSGKPSNPNITKEDVEKAFGAVVTELEKLEPNTTAIINDDASLAKWQSDIYKEWTNLYQQIKRGDGTLSKKQLDALEKVPKLASERKIRKIQREALNTKSVSELMGIYNAAKQSDEVVDIDKILGEIEDPGVQSKFKELNRIRQAFNSIGAAISASSLPTELKENLLNQVEGLMGSQNSANALYDISNYSLSGVRPDERDNIAGELSQILSSAKSTADNAQTVNINLVDSKKDSQFGPATDLGSRDVDTAPAVNKEPIKKFTPEEAVKLVNEINALLAKNEFMTATPMINELQKRCPEGYQFMQGGTQVALKKIDTSTPISEVTVDESLEEEPEFVPEGEVVIDEELDSSLDAYPDEDIRSITKIAIVTFEPGGREYAYPVRDEDVQMGDTVEGKSNQGKIERFETPDEYAVQHPDGDYTLEKLAKFKRGTFIDRHTDKAETAEPVPVKRVVTTHRSETQQSRLNANVTPARNEVSPQHIKDGSMTRLGDTNHTNIDAQLDENGAFRYVDEGMLNQDDELVFVVTEEEMPDGQKTPVIWEVTKSKTEDLPTDSKFLGYQVINVLDQTSMSGDRGELIARIREAYEKAGKPTSFLYDSEPIKVKNIVKGFIPTRQTNPVEAQSQEIISSTNLQKGLTKSNGKWGVMFKSSKTGKLMHVPVIFRQTKRDIDGNIKTDTSHIGVDTVEVIKHNPLTQNETREVMLVVPTPTGWQAAHSIYILKREIQDAVEKYKEAFTNGNLGKRLIAKAMVRFTDPKATTSFSDFLRFNRGVSERIVFDPTHNRLELGIRGNLDTTFVYASKQGETWVITEADARNILDDNEGKGFTTEEVLKRYLNALADSEDAGISLQMNMDAISKDNSIIDTLIDDGFLWAPNSYPGRLTMENVGFEAPLSETVAAEPKVEESVATKPEPAITAPKPSNPVIEEPVTTTQKIKVPDSVDSNDVGARVPRKKKSSSSEKKISITPTTPRTEQASTQEAPLIDELKIEAKKSYNDLSVESKAHLEEKGITQEDWDKHPEIHENVLNC